MSLVGVKVVQDVKNGKLLQLISSSEEKNMLIECDSAQIAIEWINSLKAHCQYANSDGTVADNNNRTSLESR